MSTALTGTNQMANLTIERQGLRFAAKDNGDGTFLIFTHDIGGGVGVADKGLEIQGLRMCAHDNGDGTFSICTTTSTGSSDLTLEHEGLRLKIHPMGENDPVTGQPMYAFVINSV
jgi:hypothetical protein